jgi:hypothetical protein
MRLPEATLDDLPPTERPNARCDERLHPCAARRRQKPLPRLLSLNHWRSRPAWQHGNPSVPTKSEQQQSGLMLHRSRQLLVRRRTMLSNAIRVTWPSSASSRRRGATAQPSCSRSFLTRRMVGYPRPHGSVLMFLPANTPRSQQRSELSRSASMPGIVQAKKAAGSSRSLVWVPASPPPSFQKSVIGKSSLPDEAWRPGSGLFPSSVRPAARNVWAESQSREIGICDGCSLPALWPLSDMRGSTARGGAGLRVSWSAGRLRSPLSRLPIGSHAWPGP